MRDQSETLPRHHLALSQDQQNVPMTSQYLILITQRFFVLICLLARMMHFGIFITATSTMPFERGFLQTDIRSLSDSPNSAHTLQKQNISTKAPRRGFIGGKHPLVCILGLIILWHGITGEPYVAHSQPWESADPVLRKCV